MVTFFGRSKKVTSRRAAPSEVEAPRFAWATSCPPYKLLVSFLEGARKVTGLQAALGVTIFAMVTAATAWAQPYPYKPIRMLSAEVGGGADLAARVVAQRMAVPLGRQIVVENRPGRLIGEMLAKANPDGYSLLLVSSTILFGPLFGETGYDPVKDFAPVSKIGRAHV